PETRPDIARREQQVGRGVGGGKDPQEGNTEQTGIADVVECRRVFQPSRGTKSGRVVGPAERESPHADGCRFHGGTIRLHQSKRTAKPWGEKSRPKIRGAYSGDPATAESSRGRVES